MGEIVLNCCRLCLKENYSFNDIFYSQSPSGDLVYSALNFVYDLQICPGDGLPPLICSPCLWKMQEFYTYKKNVHFAKAEIVKLLNEVSVGDCSNRENAHTSMDSDSAHSDPTEEQIDIEEWQMPKELKREAIDIEQQGNEPVLHDDRNIMNIDEGSCSSEVILQGIDIDVKQEESELIIYKVGAIQSIGSSDSKNHLSLEASEETSVNSFEGESICSTNDNSVEIRDTIKEINENDLRDDVVPEDESLSAELSQSILNDAESHLSHLKAPPMRKSGFICDICKKSYKGKRDLGRHVRAHYDDRPFSCNVCKKTFKQDDVRYVHELKHLRDKIENTGKGSKENQYSCSVCPKNFSSKNALSAHSNQHINKYRCKFCGKNFICNSQLTRHVRIHTKEKPFECELCSECFTQKNNLNRHLLVHSSEKAYSCDTCDKRFKTKQDMTTHALCHLRKE